jgi:hypothetical protein
MAVFADELAPAARGTEKGRMVFDGTPCLPFSPVDETDQNSPARSSKRPERELFFSSAFLFPTDLSRSECANTPGAVALDGSQAGRCPKPGPLALRA